MPREQSTASGNTHIDISADNIQLPHHQIKQDFKSLIHQNKLMRRQNALLRNQLQQLSTRLDEEIRKRLDEQKRKLVGKNEDVSLMQLQNAYKKCQIYKKQASLYRKKVQSMGDENRLQQCERKVEEYARDNQQLKEQLKQVKKISKLQEKGLVEMGAEGYLKAVADNQKLREQIRILKKQLDQNRRDKDKLYKNRTQTSSIEPLKGQAKISQRDIQFQEKVKKRIQTEHDNHPANEDLSDILQQKVEKDFQKIRALMTEKNKMREMIDNLKMQLSNKQKENATLVQKIAALRKTNQTLQAQLSIKSELDEELKLNKENKSKQTKGENSKSRLAKLEQMPPKKRIWKKDQILQQQGNAANEVSQSGIKYPRTEEKGLKTEGSRTWSHQNLSSKIKEMQVQLHQSGHIKNIHARYEKGQPKRIEEAGEKAKYMVLCCTGNEYIRHIQGCFHKGYLQCIRLTTTDKRIQEFGNLQLLQDVDQGEHFEFRVNEQEYPGALFGENDSNGIRRMGCFIHKIP